eukprot:CAMPEP_0170568706 /NCGR_PEP_ID=MMETSP0224-20130122/105_1 /TAXON_ID=285029 /ORGANISM="Togula jolla, Strain CCCM 725" /LENGTH=52 /DNA_ID=CAMNT_0010890705 /DNA_START=905 /DNA_END=1063 /DNA_ORIENTATION=+
MAIPDVLHEATPVLPHAVEEEADQGGEICLDDAQVPIFEREEGMSIKGLRLG